MADVDHITFSSFRPDSWVDTPTMASNRDFPGINHTDFRRTLSVTKSFLAVSLRRLRKCVTGRQFVGTTATPQTLRRCVCGVWQVSPRNCSEGVGVL